MADKIERGKPLDELVKGSMDYTMDLIRRAFRAAFGNDYDGADGYLYVVEYFADHVIVQSNKLKSDEFYLVRYERQGETVTFTPRDQWEVVELAYQPQSMVESKKRGKRLTEAAGGLKLMTEQAEGQPRRIRAIGITADVVNGNRRRYPAAVLERAVLRLKAHLHESAGQGRYIERPGQILGEVEHPSSKGGQPSLLETVVKWEAVDFNGSQVLLEGAILPTSKGRDILALLEGGVNIPISQRGYGEAKIIKIDNQKVEEVTDLEITGYDLVIEGSDPAAEITENKQTSQEEEIMDPEELKKLITEHPELVEGVVTSQIEKLNAVQLTALEEKMRQAMGLGAGDDLTKALAEAAQAKRELAEKKQREAVEAAINEATKGLAYGDDLNKQFVEAVRGANPANPEAVRGANPANPEAVKALVEAKRKEYDGFMAKAKLASMGFKGVQPVGPVIEQETGWPEYAKAAVDLTENIRMKNQSPRRDFRKPRTVNEEFAARLLEKFDKQYGKQLLAESKAFEEAELSTDLNLPYSVSRAIIAEAFPSLVATGIFDVNLTDQSPSRIYYETTAGETGYTVSIAASEGVTASNPLGSWVAIAHAHITPGTLVAKDHAEAVTYTEGTDYVIDYLGGRFMALVGGAIAAGGDVHLTAYTYTAIRQGENAAIERAKVTLSYKTLEIAADRLATEITREAIVFSRSQLGWDATTRTLSSLTRQIQRKIDQGLMYLGLSAALSVASNSGGTWTAAADPISEFVEKVGVAKVKVLNRYYEATSLLLSMTNADKIANWDGFTAAGKRPDSDLNANGYIGRLKGLPVFQSSEFSDGYGLVCNRELVMHRIFQAMQLRGPYPSYSSNKLVANDQYYAEEFNGSDAPVPGKGSYVKIA